MPVASANPGSRSASLRSVGHAISAGLSSKLLTISILPRDAIGEVRLDVLGIRLRCIYIDLDKRLLISLEKLDLLFAEGPGAS